MRIKLLLFVLLASFSFINAQKDYDKDWRMVEKYEIDLLPKSALKKVELIHVKAKEENNSNQLIKSIIYKSKLAILISEDAQFKVIQNIKTEINSAEFPVKNILESILANLYWQYYQKNRYRIYKKTTEAIRDDVNDFRVWNLKQFFNQIHFHFQKSLDDKLLLQQTNLSQFDYILITSENSKSYRNTLYDFIANNALDFYESNERYLAKASYVFKLDNLDFLADNDTFLKTNIQFKDSLSKHLQALFSRSLNTTQSINNQ